MAHIDIPYDDPSFEAWLTAPGLAQRLEAAIQQGLLPLDVGEQLQRDLAQHARALSGDRAEPGSYLDDPALPSEPMPFMPRETHRPDRAPGTPKGRVLRQVTENLQASALTNRLQQQMNRPEPSTWERTSNDGYGPATVTPVDTYQATTPQADDPPPSLRESIEAAASVVAPEVME